MSDRKLSRLRPSQRQVECSVCNDTVGEYASATIESNVVCRHCIRQIFEPALKEHNYPAKWGSTRLEARDFEHLLGADFFERYRQKEIEYTTEIKHRVYCICGTFVSGRPHRSNVRTKLPCPNCGKLVCTHCKAMTSATEPHRCEEHLGLEAVMEAQAPKRGVDYDVESPCCGAKISRIDGCNEITCCGKSFCFVCGNPVVHGHFQRGGCPRFDQREPVYDDEYDSDDDDDDDDDSDDDDSDDSDDDDDEEDGPLDLANNPRHNGYVDDLARRRVQYAIAVGTTTDDDSGTIRSIVHDREWFLIDHHDVNTEEERDEVVRIMNERIQMMMAVAQEVGLLWQDDGLDRPLALTPLKQAVVYILGNLRTESWGHPAQPQVPEEFGTGFGFEFRHQAAEEAIISKGFAVGQERMENDYPRLLEFWRTYLEKMSGLRQILLQSDLGALNYEIEIFVFRARTQTEQQRIFANELRDAVIGIWNWHNKLPQLLDGARPAITRTESFVVDHRRFLQAFVQFEDFGLEQRLPLTRGLWQRYLDRFPTDLDKFIAEASEKS